LPGDVDGNHAVDIVDAILALRIMAGMESGRIIPPSADVNGDGKIGFTEALHALQVEVGLRNP